MIKKIKTTKLCYFYQKKKLNCDNDLCIYNVSIHKLLCSLVKHLICHVKHLICK